MEVVVYDKECFEPSHKFPASPRPGAERIQSRLVQFDATDLCGAVSFVPDVHWPRGKR
jgi:hypothetical protein